MSWERDPLLAKAKLYFERAFELPREDHQFGLWCALGLELLARAAVASISPSLLAEPDAEQKNLLHSLGYGPERISGKSIGTVRVLALCRALFKDFREEELRACAALLNRRNDELHTGGAAFSEYPMSAWLAGFYRSCDVLAKALGESLETVFGADEASIASKTIAANENDIRQKVQSSIAAHAKVFAAKDAAERDELARAAAEAGDKLAHFRRHRVTCPACNAVALVQGELFGKERVSHTKDEIVVQQSVAPTSFACSVCGLKLDGVTELDVAELSGHYTRTSRYSPEEYYGLVNLDTLDMEELAMKWLGEQEYDNE